MVVQEKLTKSFSCVWLAGLGRLAVHAPTGPQIGLPYDLDAYMRYGTSSVANITGPWRLLSSTARTAQPSAVIRSFSIALRPTRAGGI